MPRAARPLLLFGVLLLVAAIAVVTMRIGDGDDPQIAGGPGTDDVADDGATPNDDAMDAGEGAADGGAEVPGTETDVAPGEAGPTDGTTGNGTGAAGAGGRADGRADEDPTGSGADERDGTDPGTGDTPLALGPDAGSLPNTGPTGGAGLGAAVLVAAIARRRRLS